MLIAFVREIFPSGMALRIVSFVFYLAGIAAIYFLGERLKGGFAGLWASIGLAFNPVYFGSGASVLTDVPLTFFCIIYIFLLAGLDPHRPLRYHLILATVGGLAVLLKWSGAVLIPVTLVAYGMRLSPMNWPSRAARALIPTGTMLFLLWLFMRIAVATSFSGFLGRIAADVGDYQRVGINILSAFAIVGAPALRWLCVLGILGLRNEKRYTAALLLSWLATFIPGIAIFIPAGVARYYLPLLPCLVLIMGMAVEQAVSAGESRWAQRFLRPAALGMALAGYLVSLTQFNAAVMKQENINLGYADAGAVIRKLANSDTVILAASERQLRYFTGFNLQEFGGNIVPLRYEKQELEEFLRKTPGEVLIVLDCWEALQPSWVRLGGGETTNYLHSLGFELVDVVHGFLDPQHPEAGMRPWFWIYRN